MLTWWWNAAALDWGTNQVSGAGDTALHVAGDAARWGGHQLENAGATATKWVDKALNPHWW